MGIAATRALQRAPDPTFTQARLVALCGSAASHPSPGVQLYEEQPQVPRGEMVIFRGNKTYVSFSLAVGWGQLHCPVTASTLSETECRGRSGSISLPTPLSTKLWCCRGKKKKDLLFSFSDLDQASAQTKVKQACPKPLKDRIYTVITVMETDLYNFYTV